MTLDRSSPWSVYLTCKVIFSVDVSGTQEWDATNFDQIYECMKHSDTVYNLVGRDWETR